MKRENFRFDNQIRLPCGKRSRPWIPNVDLDSENVAFIHKSTNLLSSWNTFFIREVCQCIANLVFPGTFPYMVFNIARKSKFVSL